MLSILFSLTGIHLGPTRNDLSPDVPTSGSIPIIVTHESEGENEKAVTARRSTKHQRRHRHLRRTVPRMDPLLILSSGNGIVKIVIPEDVAELTLRQFIHRLHQGGPASSRLALRQKGLRPIGTALLHQLFIINLRVEIPLRMKGVVPGKERKTMKRRKKKKKRRMMRRKPLLLGLSAERTAEEDIKSGRARILFRGA